MNDDKYRPFMTTRSGKQIFFHDPNPDDIDLGDIAYALAGMYRWGGHADPRWSVAQHSILGALICEPAIQLEFLFHDAAEAYLGDIIRPIKRMPEVHAMYSLMEDHFCQIMAAKFGFAFPFPPRVKEMDEFICFNESRALLKSATAGHLYVNDQHGGVDPSLTPLFRYQYPAVVEVQFMQVAATLINERRGE